MRVGYVLKKFPRISETFILNEILERQRQGDQVAVFSLLRPDDGLFHAGLVELVQPVYYPKDLTAAGTQELLRANLGLLRGARATLFELLDELLTLRVDNAFAILRWAVQIAAEMVRQRVEHVHAHFATVASEVAYAIHRLTGLPFSFTCHAKDIYRCGVNAERFDRLAAAAEAVVTVCQANRAHIHSALVGPDRARVEVVYNGVDLTRFHPSARRPDPTPLLLGVGRLVEKKGLHFLVEAAARLLRSGRDLRCAIAGDGEQRETLAAQIRALEEPRIQLLGACTSDGVRDLFQRAAAMVLPCVVGEDGNRDALPTVLLEALAAGVPVVSTPVAGVEEIVDHGDAGVLVPPGDVDALTAALAALLDDEPRQRQLAERGRRHAERNFDLVQNVALLRQCTAARAAARVGR